MAYTHYWRHKKVTKKQLDKLIPMLKTVLAVFDESIAGPMGDPDTRPILNDKQLVFNGSGEEDSYETFAYDFDKNKEFIFCKTARKPYDLPVCICLLVLGSVIGFGEKGINLSSDGFDEEPDGYWSQAIEWFNAELTTNCTLCYQPPLPGMDQAGKIERIATNKCKKCISKIWCSLHG